MNTSPNTSSFGIRYSVKKTRTLPYEAISAGTVFNNSYTHHTGSELHWAQNMLATCLSNSNKSRLAADAPPNMNIGLTGSLWISRVLNQVIVKDDLSPGIDD